MVTNGDLGVELGLRAWRRGGLSVRGGILLAIFLRFQCAARGPLGKSVLQDRRVALRRAEGCRRRVAERDTCRRGPLMVGHERVFRGCMAETRIEGLCLLLGGVAVRRGASRG